MRKTALARELMKGPVFQLITSAPVRDAAAFLLRHGISGAPVIDDHARWVGVFTQNDLARYVQDRIPVQKPDRTLESRESVASCFEVFPDDLGQMPVSDLMTPGLYTVFPDATLDEVVHTMTAFKVHRVFVVEETGTSLLGVITTMDVLKWMDANLGSERTFRKLAKA